MPRHEFLRGITSFLSVEKLQVARLMSAMGAMLAKGYAALIEVISISSVRKM